MGKALALIEPAALAVWLAQHARRQRCEVDLHREGNLDLYAQQGRQGLRLRNSLGNRRRAPMCARTAGRPRRRLRSCLPRCLGLADLADLAGLVRAAANGRRLPHDGVERRDQRQHAGETARKDRLHRARAGEPLPLQERPGGGALAKLVERKRVQQMRCRRAPYLGEPAEDNERAFGLCVEHRRGGSHQQNGHVLGTGGNRFLCQGKDTPASARVGERLKQPICPDVGPIQPILEQVCLAQCRTCHLLRSSIRVHGRRELPRQWNRLTEICPSRP